MGVKLGEVYETNKSGSVKVIDCQDYKNVKVEFIQTGHIKTTHVSNVVAGSLKDPYYPSVHNLGFLGEGPHKVSENSKITSAYSVWEKMIARCTKEREGQYRTYLNICFVNKSWYNFQNFAKFFYEDGYRKDGWNLDKDILFKGNKEYGPDTCCFVPQEVNKVVLLQNKYRGEFPIGVSYSSSEGKFKWSCKAPCGTKDVGGSANSAEEAFNLYAKAKKVRITFVANKYKNEIDPKVYEALLNFEIKITD